MGRGPNRRCEIVTAPDFFESYTKNPCAKLGESSPMILIEFLLAPTVPSAPRPKKTARTTSGSSIEKSGSTSSDSRVTSSMMPTVNCGFGCGLASSSKMARTMAGVNSLEASP